MKILSKYKDYYDYLQDPTDNVVYDRRDMIIDTDWLDIICRFPTGGIVSDSKYELTIGLRIGHKIFVFLIKVILKANSYIYFHPSSEEIAEFNITLIGERFDYDYTGEPINWYWFISNERDKKWRIIQPDVINGNLANIENHDWNYDFYNKRPNYHEYHIPLLQKTVASYIQPKDIYINLDNYIRSLKNDKNYESKDITDLDKVVNHGFDTKSSFRNVK